jgi:hypothetical protein
MKDFVWPASIEVDTDWAFQNYEGCAFEDAFQIAAAK